MKPPETVPAAVPRHLHSLDALRGIAALGTVLWHWQHFFFQGTHPGAYDQKQQPFFSLLQIFYTNGARGVDIFFCLSGFVFFWLYGESVRNGKTSAWDFTARRFSRLYPLHLATLLFVAAGQAIMLHWREAYFVYPKNDLHHFILQLFMASNWGLQSGYSFNFPAWSVSIEVVCYAVFYLVCRGKADRWWELAVFALVGLCLREMGKHGVAQGILSFFIGAMTYRVFAVMLRQGLSPRTVPLLAAMTALVWGVVSFNVRHEVTYHWYLETFDQAPIAIAGFDPMAWLLLEFDARGYELFCYPLTILTLALWETSLGGFRAPLLATLGQVSYPVYMWHFPLQLVFAGLVAGLGWSSHVFYSPWVFLAFFGLLIPLSLSSYRCFEVPCQRWLRAALLSRKKTSVRTNPRLCQGPSDFAGPTQMC